MPYNLPIKQNELKDTYKLLQPFIHKTPVITSRLLNDLAQADLFFKCESLQRTGSFKIRGATSAVLALSEEQQRRGVVTHSSGNFAQALAFAATQLGVKSWIVMPENAPDIKKQATAGYGGEIILCKPTIKDRETTALSIIEQKGATFIHPYNQYSVIRGQSTVAMELIEDMNHLDYIISPIGGGGLISGIALACHYFSDKTKVIGAEPLGADDAFRSFHTGKLIPQTNPQTIADGLRTSLGDLTFPIIKELVTNIYTVTETQIMNALKLFWTRTKIIIEPSSAVTLAVVLNNQNIFSNKRVGVILSGGNIDIDRLFEE